jgi:hypothetical protein
MATARITITLREEFGLTATSLRHPGTEFRYLAGIEEPDRGLGLVEVLGPDIDEVLEEVEATEAVRAFELLERSETRAVFQYETDVAELYRVVREAGIVPAFPYTIRNGELLFTTTTTAERLSRLAESLRSLGIPFDVTSVAGTGDEPSLLTERQRQFVETAVEAGYYDTPRGCTLTELAAEIGVASSTASRILHRAEERLVKRYVEDPAARGGVSGDEGD